MRAAFVFPNPRAKLLEAVRHNDAPDSSLLGANHLAEHGIDAYVHDPRLARERSSWLRWQLREFVLPWEVRDADLLVTPLFRYVGYAGHVARGPKLVVVNFGLNVLLRHASPTRRRALLAILRQPVRIVGLSEAQRRELIELSGLPPARVATVRLGIDADFFRPEDVLDDPPLVLTVGKDLARDYTSFAAAVRDLPVTARIAALPRNVAGVGLPRNVTAGVSNAHELRQYYRRASCVVISQYRDSHSVGTEHGGTTALLEALAMGKAVIVTDRSTLHEYIVDGETALLVPPEDPAALRSAIERVLGDDELRLRLGRAGRKRVEEEFTTRQMAERFVPVLQEAATA